MILRGGRVALDARTAERMDLGIERGRIRMNVGRCGGPEIDCSGMMILPGLINAHDHLEFNLFPRLGAGPYPNAGEWARDIYHPDRSPVREQIAVPKAERLVWGGLKNLLSGVTTVMHHNPYEPQFDSGFPVRVVQRYGWAHSPAFAPDFAARYRATPPDVPFFIHAAEGTDACAEEELRRMEAAGALGANTVIIHGVAAGVDALERAGASLVWCPTSNLFTVGRTLGAGVLECGIPIALGTDSALTAAGDVIDEMAAAAEFVSRERVYDMVTREAARVLRLSDGQGEIREDGVADLVMARDFGGRPADALQGLRPVSVWIDGEKRLEADDRGPLWVEGRGRYRASARIPAPGPAFRLAGRRVAA